ncbi:MAG: hypothetical protein FWE62_01680 [Firmicutes bacterium]|nr:hypothetical protein [Bacillota bacterium]
MPTYTYKFCDGTVKKVEVSGTEYALLADFDKQEIQNNLRQKRRNIPLARYVRKEENADRRRDKAFKEDNK